MDTFANLDRARPGQENMDIDRRMLEAAEQNGCAYLRLYRWSEATLSLGHFQADIDRTGHPASQRLPAVVRQSGGGAIVHHHEWTYSIALPVGRNKVGASTQLYDTIHDALVIGLRTLGWDARKWAKDMSQTSLDKGLASTTLVGCGSEDACAMRKSDGQQFLCFQRRSCGDIVVGPSKVVGSAQRRLGSSVLQHGSLLWETSSFAPELPGLIQIPRTLGPRDDQLPTLDQMGAVFLGWLKEPLEAKFDAVFKESVLV